MTAAPAFAIPAPSTPPPTTRPSLAGVTRAGLAEALRELGLPAREVNMRAGQLWHWIYHRGVRDFGEMRNVAKPMREPLGRALHARRAPRSSPSRCRPTAPANG